MTSTSQLTTSLLHPSLSSGRNWAESQAEVWPQMNCWVFRLQLADRSRTLKRVYSTGRVYHSRLFKYFKSFPHLESRRCQIAKIPPAKPKKLQGKYSQYSNCMKSKYCIYYTSKHWVDSEENHIYEDHFFVRKTTKRKNKLLGELIVKVAHHSSSIWKRMSKACNLSEPFVGHAS